MNLTPAQFDELSKRIMARVEGRRLSPAQVRQAVAEEVVAYETTVSRGGPIGPQVAEVLGAIDRLPGEVAGRVRRPPHELSESEFRAFASNRANELLPTPSGMPVAPGARTVKPTMPIREMTLEERRAYEAEAGHRLLPGDERGRTG